MMDLSDINRDVFQLIASVDAKFDSVMETPKVRTEI